MGCPRVSSCRAALSSPAGGFLWGEELWGEELWCCQLPNDGFCGHCCNQLRTGFLQPKSLCSAGQHGWEAPCSAEVLLHRLWALVPPLAPRKPGLCLAVVCCQMKGAIFFPESWPYQAVLPQGSSQQTCYIGLLPVPSHKRAVRACTSSIGWNYLISGATGVSLVRDRGCSLLKGLCAGSNTPCFPTAEYSEDS